MGFLSKIWKGIKGVVKGVLKVFSPILKPIGKILGSKWGKAIMLALSVFTMGASLMAGFSAFQSTAGSFLTKFIAGGKAFVGRMFGIKQADQAGGEMAGKAGDASNIVQGDAVNPGDLLGTTTEGGIAAGGSGSGAFGPGPTGDVMQRAVTGPGSAGGAAGQGAMLPPGAGDSALLGALKSPPPGVPGGGGGGGGGNWLSNAAKSAWEFAKSEPGLQILGGALEGYQQGKRDDAFLAEQRRIDDMWRNPNDPGMLGIEGSRQQLEDYNAPRGLAGAGGRLAYGQAQENIRNYVPSVPYQPELTGGA